ncbi:LysR family transcriptional regulator [Xanthobacter sp. KR7-225]|uniref:LysR family transcriptional regulator n=1 Tax=Xanthobacter sp. KR7-225 TaxID=3156613 RepID=UPI0032B47B1A
MKRVDLADLDVFVAVARARSFRGAATRRGASPSALSEALRRLEADLGVRLLNRTTRSVTPTEAGRILLERLGPALDDVALALDAVNAVRDSPAGTLRLNVPVVVARLVLPEIVPRFLERYPAITLSVTSDNRFVDVLSEGFDAGVRYGERLAQDMVAVPIGPRQQRFVTAAAPDYLARRGRPLHPRELERHTLLSHVFESGAMPAWEFEKDGVVERVAAPGPLATSEIDLKLAAARAGLGILHSFEGFLAPALGAGALVAILEDWSQPFAGPFLYFPSRRHMPAPLRAFVDFLKEK